MMTEEQKQALIADAQATIELFESAGSTEQIVYKLAKIALTALTQPASPALKLPDAVIPSVHLNSNAKSAAESARNGGKIDGWNLCFAEVVRLNAPHTAPIEPICATGGAEWVKVSERMPEDYEDVIASDGYEQRFAYWDAAEEYWLYPGDSLNEKPTHWMPLPSAPDA